MSKLWINEELWITSDTHFGHARILEKEPSRITTMHQEGEEGDVFEWMLRRWNRSIAPKEPLLHLGDVAGKEGRAYLGRLHGEKHLLLGNHDLKNLPMLQEAGFLIHTGIKLYIPQEEEILESLKRRFSSGRLKEERYLHAIVADLGMERILFSHLPVFDINPFDHRYESSKRVLEALYEEAHCTLNIHGHTHSYDTPNSFCLNASWEKSEMRPMRLRELLFRFRNKSI